MRILHLIDTLGPGGAQIVLRGILEHQKNNKDVFLYALRKTPVTVSIDHSNATIDTSPYRFDLRPLLRVREFITQNDIELLHCHLPKAHLFGLLLKKLLCRSIKLILHEHGDILKDSKVHRYILRQACHYSQCIIACSEATKNDLIRKLPGHGTRIVRLYNFVDLDKYDASRLSSRRDFERRTLNIFTGDFVFGFAGRLVEAKGWRDFVDAATYFEHNAKIKFVIVGSGGDQSKLSELIHGTRAYRNVKYLGYCADMLKFYSIIDCLVVPSHREAMGIAAIEAHALRIPVIAADVPGLSEVIINGKTGLLFKSRDVQALQHVMNLVLQADDLRNEIVANARQRVQNFTLSHFIAELNAIYQSVTCY